MSFPFHIYVDLDVSNDDLNPTSQPPQLSFEVTRNHPFLEGNASNYFVTISRFSIQTGSSLPVFIPSIVPNQPDVNKTVYSITIVNTVTKLINTEYIEYVPSNLSLPTPSSPVTTQDYTNKYYHVMNYQDFIAMVNNALVTLWGKTGLSGPIAAAVPFIEFDPSSYISVLNVPQTAFTTANYDIYFNTRLMQLFTGLPAIFKTYDGELNYQINVAGSLNNTRSITVSYSAQSAVIAFVQVNQELSAVGLWNPVRSIVFVSNTLPIYATQTSPPQLYNSTNTGMMGSGVPNISNILSDFEIPISATNQYRPEINYAPPGEYRLIDLYNNSDLYKIDLNVFWKDKYNNLNPFLLQAGCSANVKLLFRHKHFYLGYDY